MTNPNLTLIAVVLDKSGSMKPVAEATLTGLNTFLDEQRKLPGDVRFTLVQFGSDVRTIYDYVDLKTMAHLTPEDYRIGGWTAMNDAIGETIDSVGQKLASMPESERPGKVVFVIQTDGHENYSNRYNRSMIKERIEHQNTKYNWQFLFLGANQDAILAGADLGIGGAFSMTYNATPYNIANTFSSVSRSIGSYRLRTNVSVKAFTEEDRAGAVADADPSVSNT